MASLQEIASAVGVGDVSQNTNSMQSMAQVSSDPIAGYGDMAQKYLDRDVFKGTPITGDMLEKAARKTFEKYGQVPPVSFVLSQAQFESGMGTKGRNPKTNPFNVGEFDSGTKQRFKNTQEGIDAYYDLIMKDYAKSNGIGHLYENYVNKNGDRYASNPNYENKLKEQAKYIENFLNKEKK
jgi:hypothetical protein